MMSEKEEEKETNGIEEKTGEVVAAGARRQAAGIYNEAMVQATTRDGGMDPERNKPGRGWS